MSIFSRLFTKKKSDNEQSDAESNIEEFITMIGIYNQAFVMTHFGITNIKMFPDLMMYKQVMRIPTAGGKVGVGERAFVKKWMMAEYKLEDTFFKEIDSSIRRNCKGINNVQNYFMQFGAFSNDFLTHLSTEYQYKLSAASLFKGLLRSTISSAVEKMMSNKVWKSFETRVTVERIQHSAKALGFSEQWIKEFAFQVISLSRKK